MITYPNCKVNLGLIVTGRRDDGFHNIETVFYPVFDLFDILEIVPSDEFAFTSSGITIDGNNADNICVKAYNMLAKEFDIPNVKIHLHKQIPVGAGLGGGSADATFTLRMINDLFGLGLKNTELEHYAAQLGSDTSFFVENKPVFAYNRGTDFDRNILIPDLSKYRFEVRDMNIHIGTKEAYKGIVPDANQLSPKDIIRMPIEEWRYVLKNQFEDSIFKTHPEIGMMKEQFYADGAVYASMSGSGSAVFGIYRK